MTNKLISKEEISLLQEIMNIAFGAASADLEEIVSIYVELHVPEVEVISGGGLGDHILKTIKLHQLSCVIEQHFWGDFRGTGLLVFPKGSGQRLIAVLEGNDRSDPPSVSDDVLEQGVLLEVGNILMGACIGKIAELLKTVVTYTPPNIMCGEETVKSFEWKDDGTQVVIIMRTFFRFKNEDINGYLLLLTPSDSLLWLKKALHKFLGSNL